MVDQGPAPLLNRAWPRRGWASAPRFGRSVDPIMMETTVRITRVAVGAAVTNPYGGFTRQGGGGLSTVFEGPAHVERVEETRPVATEAEASLGVVIYQHYEVFMPIPADPAQIPRADDVISFSDGISMHSQPIRTVIVNAGLLDHIEIRTDEFAA